MDKQLHAKSHAEKVIDMRRLIARIEAHKKHGNRYACKKRQRKKNCKKYAIIPLPAQPIWDLPDGHFLDIRSTSKELLDYVHYAVRCPVNYWHHRGIYGQPSL